jgi:hypothetical protein
MGGFETMKDAVIDDCELARRVKSSGNRIWVGLTRSVRSVRPYGSLREIGNMVARTAYTQLRYSTALLVLCTLAMAVAFWVPIVAIFSLRQWPCSPWFFRIRQSFAFTEDPGYGRFACR